MGGQSTTIASTSACTEAFDIRAAALHHPEDSTLSDTTTGDTLFNAGSNVSVPLAVFTSR